MSVVDRLRRLREAMAQANIPALLVTQPESRRYLSGFRAPDLPPRESAGCLLITESRQFLLTDPRTAEVAAAEAPDFELRTYGGARRMSDLLRDLTQEVQVRVIGFDPEHATVQLWQHLVGALSGRAVLRLAPPLVDQLRMIKDEDELRALRSSIALNDAAFAHLAQTLRPGVTELELAWEMENFVRTHGGEDISFPPITVGGPNSAIPHAIPGPRPIQDNELVLFDIGAKVDGYCSDMTRTVGVGAVPQQLRDIWNVVLEAQLEAEARAGPGMTGAEVDQFARDVIAQAGFGDNFGHGVGHGIGLEIHEPPWITPARGTDVLQCGMVFSIEPGVYLPGLGGVRIEDLVLVTPTGVEILSQSSKKFDVMEVRGDLNR